MTIIPSYWENFLARAITIFLVLPIIQYCKCVTACKLGDNSPEMLERKTINPLAHLDILGTILMLLGGIGWAKPLPINIANFYKTKDRRTGYLIMALAGPCGCLILAFIFTFIFTILANSSFAMSRFGMSLLYVLNGTTQCATFFALFSLLPIPGFPGEALGEYFCPDLMWKLKPYRPMIIILFVFLISFSPTAAFSPLRKLTQLITRTLSRLSLALLRLFA
jgi:Zn-dependent protease